MSAIPANGPGNKDVTPSNVGQAWGQAYIKLSDKDRLALEPYASNADVPELAQLIANGVSATRNGKWKVRGVVLHDVFEKMAKWLKDFLRIGDVLVQYDPVHAAVPWAVLRFAVQVSLNSIEKNAVLIQGSEYICRIVVWARIQEALCLDAAFEAQSYLLNAFVDLYYNMFKFLADVVRHLTSKTYQKFLSSVLLAGQSHDQRLESIKNAQNIIELYSRQISQTRQALLDNRSKTIVDILQSFEQPIVRIDVAVTDASRMLTAMHDEALLDWISSFPYQKSFEQARDKILNSTGQWLLRREQYEYWHSSSSSQLLWLHGVPGSGKSTLLSVAYPWGFGTIDLLTVAARSIVLADLFKFHDSLQATQPIYFYCSRNPAERECSQPEHILRTLVREVVQLPGGSAIHASLRERHDRRAFSGRLSCSESVELLISALNERTITYILIDALDECEPSTRSRLFDALELILLEVNTLVKIFVTSRDDKDIVALMRRLVSKRQDCAIRIEAADNQADIQSYVDIGIRQSVAKGSSLAKCSGKLRGEITQRLCSGAQGMFRWVELQLQFICSLKLASSIERRLGELPETLSQTYEDLYNQQMPSDHDEREIARNIFRWLLCAQRRLSTADFIALLSSQSDCARGIGVDEVLDLCFNLVVHDEHSDVFRFAHTSVREFLEQKLDMSPINGDTYPMHRNHHMAATACLRIILKPSIAQYRALVYAQVFWAEHVRLHRIEGSTLDLPELQDFLKPDSREFRQWTATIEALYSAAAPYMFPDCWTSTHLHLRFLNAYHPLLLASEWGFEDVVDRFTAELSGLELQQIQTPDRINALHFAAEENHCCILASLLAAGMDANLTDRFQVTPLDIAVAHNHLEAVKTILEHHKAAPIELHSKAIARRSVTLASVRTTLPTLSSPLHVAASLGYSLMIELLLSQFSSSLNFCDNHGQTPLFLASSAGHNETVLKLLMAGASVNISNKGGTTVLKTAAAAGHKTVIRTLLSYGASLSACAGKQSLCLHLAVMEGLKILIVPLLEHGTPIDARDEGGKTALHLATERGYASMICKLLRRKARFEDPDNDGNTPLHLAAREKACSSPSPDSVKHGSPLTALLRAGAPVNARNHDGETPLLLAVKSGNTWAAKQLVDARADLSLRDVHGSCALDVAQILQNEELLSILAERAALPRTSHSPQRSPASSREMLDFATSAAALELGSQQG